MLNKNNILIKFQLFLILLIIEILFIIFMNC